MNVFVSELDSGLTTLIACHFVGGGKTVVAMHALGIDAAGDIYITGYTRLFKLSDDRRGL